MVSAYNNGTYFTYKFDGYTHVIPLAIYVIGSDILYPLLSYGGDNILRFRVINTVTTPLSMYRENGITISGYVFAK